MNPELPAEEKMKKSPCPSWPTPEASYELCPVADSNRSQLKSAFRILLWEQPNLTAGDPLEGLMWMLVPGAGSHGALVLSASRSGSRPRSRTVQKRS